ncbi:MAG: hypothetical protein UT48_C0021G0013 [Parcubacteria group bacterium GW2011_GWE2_39_37]|nr:MAG: hypothetical protein UT48_C0021G0013 [Parcubacteria group bacterium GW2011_GWE2_39_37]
MVSAEIILWSRLKNKQLKGLKFRRQYSIGNFVVDFYCPEFKLVIELDGMTHDNSENKDIKRQEFIESFGIKCLRFTNNNIYKELDKVLEFILNTLPPRPSATPPCKGGDK